MRRKKIPKILQDTKILKIKGRRNVERPWIWCLVIKKPYKYPPPPETCNVLRACVKKNNVRSDDTIQSVGEICDKRQIF